MGETRASYTFRQRRYELGIVLVRTLPFKNTPHTRDGCKSKIEGGYLIQAWESGI